MFWLGEFEKFTQWFIYDAIKFLTTYPIRGTVQKVFVLNGKFSHDSEVDADYTVN